MTTNGYGVPFRVMKMFKMVLVVAYLHGYKEHCKWVNFIVCELHLNKDKAVKRFLKYNKDNFTQYLLKYQK